MSETIVLDSRPLSQITHPRKFKPISDWFNEVVELGYHIVIPEIVDYEVRRGLMRIPAPAQISRLDGMGMVFLIDPITRPVMHDAAYIWAKARNMGKPFTSDNRLDGDAILIAQIRALGSLEQLAVITENIKHLKPFVPAMQWRDFEG